MQLAEFTETMDRILEADPESFGDAESMRTLFRYRARFEAWLAKATAAFEVSGQWTDSGAQTAATWLAVETKVPKAEARRAVRLGRALRQLPAAGSAWLAGDIGTAHLDALTRARNPRTEAALERDEAELVGQGRRLRFEDFTRVLDYWALRADPDGAEDRAESQRQGREAYLAASFGGMWLGRLTLDPVSGAIVDNELRRLTEQLFEADWSEAKTRLGREPLAGELRRTAAQRRADAFVEMATRSASMAPGSRRAAPLVSFLVDYGYVPRLCELAQGLVVTPGSVLRHLTEADVERVVFSAPNRIDVSETQRFFSGGLRRKVQVQDRVCQHSHCDRPAVECQVDHIIPFSEGGPTTLENARLLCEFHNRLEYQKWLKERRQHPPPDAA